MNPLVIRRLAAATAVAAATLALSSCLENEEQQREINSLREQLEVAGNNLQTTKRRIDKLEERNKELETALRESKSQARTLESQLKTARRDLEKYEQRELLAREAKEKEPSREEKRENARELAQKSFGALVTITGDQSSGTGFLVEADGKSWVYLAASTLAGNSKLDLTAGGQPLREFGSFEVAAKADLARLEVRDAPDSKLVPAQPSEVGASVPLLAIATGPVVIEGRARDSEDGHLQTDSKLGECLSGSPVFHGESGNLLGILADSPTAERSLWESATTTYSRSRKAVHRLDLKIDWSPIPIATFLEEARLITQTDRLTRLIQAFGAVSIANTGVTFGGSLGGSQSVQKFLETNRSAPAVRDLFALDEWLRENGRRASPRDVSKRVRRVYESITRNAESQARELRKKTFCPFHQPAVQQSLAWRQDALKKLNNVLAAFADS